MRDLARAGAREIVSHRRVERYQPEDRHVWLIRPDHLGDVLFLRPALRRFRQSLPDWHITLAIGPWSRAVVDADPNVDEVVEIRFPGFDRNAVKRPWQPYQLLFAEAERLRARRPQAVILLREDHWWGALLARQAGVPIIIGAESPTTTDLLTDQISMATVHAVERNAEMLDFAARTLAGDLSVRPVNWRSDELPWQVTDDDRASAADLLQHSGVDRPFVVIHPGSGAAVKLWPGHRWAAVSDEIAKLGLDVVLTGTGSEMAQVETIVTKAKSQPRSLAGQTSLRQLAAIFEQSLLVAGVDSGPLHLAVAVGRPTVHLYGPSSVETFGPWGNPDRQRVLNAGMVCPSCGDLSLSRPAGAGCMMAIREDQVSNVIREMLP